MKCSLCKEEILNINDYNVFRNNAYVINECVICDKCLEHMANGGKFARVDNLSLNTNSFGDSLVTAIDAWISYKTLKGDSYTERGKQTLVARIKNEIKATSEDVVVAKINNSIDHKWKGICWEDNSFLKPQIVEMFEKTWNDLIVNLEGKEEAKRYYLYLFKTYSDINKIKTRARQIYAAYRDYVNNLSDEKYCKTFYNWLRAEVPVE